MLFTFLAAVLLPLGVLGVIGLGLFCDGLLG